MTPPANADAICGGCFLFERRGVCPAARDAYDLHNSVEAERRAERFRQAVVRDAKSTVGLRELVRLDAERKDIGRELAASHRLGLLAPASPSASDNSAKEKARVAPRTVR